MNRWTDYVVNNDRIINLIKTLRENGYKTFILSNAPYEIPDMVNARGLNEIFDGSVFSCFEHINKPDSRLYQILLEKYDLENGTNELKVYKLERTVNELEALKKDALAIKRMYLERKILRKKKKIKSYQKAKKK